MKHFNGADFSLSDLQQFSNVLIETNGILDGVATDVD
jgi:hypothetical protein